MSSDIFYSRARIAALTRSRTADDPELLDARRNLAVANLERYIQRTVDAAPELNQAQRQRLATLLIPAVGGASRAS